jgi:TPR repeat protein
MKTNFLIIFYYGKATRLFLIFTAMLISSSLCAQLINLRSAVGAGAVVENLLKHKKNQSSTNQNNNTNNNNSPVKDTASVLDFNSKPLSAFTAAHIQDISGVWEGEQSNGGLIMYYQIALFHLSGDMYSGYDYCIWVKTLDHKPVADKNGQIPKGEKTFIAKFDEDAGLKVTEIAALANTNWGPGSELFKFVDDNGTPAIINANTGEPNRKFYLKRTNQSFPQDSLKNVVTLNTLEISTPVFKNSDNTSSLKYNDHGQLSLSIKNNSQLDFSNLKGQFTTTEQQNGIIDYDKLYGIFSIQKNGELSLPLNIKTNFSVPTGTEHFNIVFSYQGVTIAQKTIEIPTQSFYKTASTTVPEYTSARLKAVSGYYGFSNVIYNDASKQLEPLIASGDKIASMWKAAFLFMGRGEYKHDEAEAYNVAKNSVATVEAKARDGNAEALYLLWYACQMGLEGEAAETLGNAFLQKSSDAGFMPAVYDNALQAYQQKNYTVAYAQFQKLSDEGMQKADNMIGVMYEQGYGINKDDNTAIEWYKKGMAFGDPDAMLSLANIYAAGFEDTQPDITKAMSFANLAAAKNCTEAMVFLGRKYADGKQGVAQNMPIALKWLNKACELGDRKAMLAMGAAYLSDEPGLTKDEQKGIYWIKKAAESGSPKAMKFLYECYQKGDIVGADEIAARFWHNQAAIAGYDQADATGVNAQAQTFSDFWNNADFSPSYVYVDEYNNEVGDSGDGLLNGLVGGMLGAMGKYYGNQQQLIDGLEYIYKKNGHKIYGGTVSSILTSNLYLKQGQSVNIKCYGTISTGMFSGLANADGLGNSYQEYTFIKGIPCSSVMAEIKDGNWQFIGQKNSFTATKDGPLVFALNGIDYRNYKGYFDIVVQVPE